MHILANVFHDLAIVKVLIVKETPILLKTLENHTPFQQHKGKLGNFTHNGISEKFFFTSLTSHDYFLKINGVSLKKHDPLLYTIL